MPGYESLYRTLGIRPQPQSAVLPVEGDEDLAGMLTDADVTDMQDADLNEQTAFNSKLPVDPITGEKRGVTSLKSAYDTKQQGMGALRRSLFPARLNAQTAVASAGIKGQSDMGVERMKASSAERVAAINAQAKADNEAERNAFTAGQGALNREAVGARVGMTQAGTTARAKVSQSGQNARQMRGQNESRAKAFEAQAGKIGALGNMFGAKDKLLKQAADLRAQAMAQSGQDDELQQAAQNFRQAYPTNDPAEILQILQSLPGISPEDMQAVYDELTQGQ